MKIYYASQSFYPHIGGVSTYLLNLTRELTKRGNEVVEIHLRPAGEEAIGLVKGVEVRRVPKEPIDKALMEQYSKFKEAIYIESHYNKKTFTKEAKEMPGFLEFNKVNEYFGQELSELFEDEKADIVEINDFQLLFAYRYIPRGIPLIMRWHIPFIDEMSKQLKEFLVKHLNEYDKVLFSSEDYIKAANKAGLNKNKAVLFYPIANTRLFKRLELDCEKVKEKYKIPRKSKIILCVQRVDPKSGHEQLIKAMPDILKKVPEAKLVFVGGESLSNKLSKDRAKLKQEIDALIKKLKLQKSIIFTGTIDYNSLPEIYNCSDLVALCSKNEGFGLSVTEGMACGKPIVGTNVGGIPIQVKDGKNGFLVGVGDHKKTAKAIIKILTDEKIRKIMGNKSLEYVDKKFKIERAVEKRLSLYNKLRQEKDEFHNLEYFKAEDIRAIITDLDRTITDKPGKPYFDAADYDTKLFTEMKKAGIPLFLATGRTLSYVKKLSNKFKVWQCIIAENGAVIYFPKTKKTITTNTVYQAKVKKIVRDLNLPGVIIGKIIISIPEEHEKIVMKNIEKYLGNVQIIRNVDEIMILPKGVDKGTGVRLALKYFDIDIEKTIVVGDGENDVEMFSNPGFKVALQNAHPSLKALANTITKYSSTRGIREILEKIKE